MSAFRLPALRSADIRTDPFPHLVIENVLPWDFYRTLVSCRPNPWSNCTPPANSRMPIPGHLLSTMAHIPECWKILADSFMDPAFTRSMAEAFGPHLHPDSPLGPLAERPEQPRSFGQVHRDKSLGGSTISDIIPRQDASPIYTEARLEVISASGTVDGGSHRRAHLDTRDRLFTALLYLRPEDDQSTGGGLDIFRWRAPPTLAQQEAFELDESIVERVATLPYQANSMVAFAQHPDALHGMAPRGPTSHQRAYMFISAEVDAPWFGASATDVAKTNESKLAAAELVTSPSGEQDIPCQDTPCPA